MLNTFLHDWLAVGGVNMLATISLSRRLTSCFLVNSCRDSLPFELVHKSQIVYHLITWPRGDSE